ncbi:MAG TPA: hypothetical protein VFS05_03650 [Gemmatimonadaceae bacterium]|nr:hypothetical protein [Gemmatimonadaceae bacterium]
MRRPVLLTLAVAGAACLCAAGAGAQTARGAAAVSAVVDTGAASASVTRRAVPSRELTVQREVFRYDDGGRRDPFLSLLGTSELRPMLSDLRLAVIVYDPRGRSRAVLKEISTTGGAGGASAKPQYYNVRVGQTLGRMRVAAIGPKSVTFTILEFGESRQETLVLNDSTTVRTTP